MYIKTGKKIPGSNGNLSLHHTEKKIIITFLEYENNIASSWDLN
jgi:hypothetical protein